MWTINQSISANIATDSIKYLIKVESSFKQKAVGIRFFILL